MTEEVLAAIESGEAVGALWVDELVAEVRWLTQDRDDWKKDTTVLASRIRKIEAERDAAREEVGRLREIMLAAADDIEVIRPADEADCAAISAAEEMLRHAAAGGAVAL